MYDKWVMRQSELGLSICVFQVVIVMNLPDGGVPQSSELHQRSELGTVAWSHELTLPISI